jgi:tetratricopeptide (TPR) repeat protein
MAPSRSLRPSILFWYGRFLMLLKRRAGALRAFRAAARDDPGHRRAWSHVGFLCAARGELEQALAAFQHAASLEPAEAAAHFNLAFVLQRLGRHAEAIPHFERAVEIDPGLERARAGLARSLAERK